MNKNKRSVRNLGEEEMLWIGRERVTSVNPGSSQVENIKSSANPLTLWQWNGESKPLPKS